MRAVRVVFLPRPFRADPLRPSLQFLVTSSSGGAVPARCARFSSTLTFLGSLANVKVKTPRRESCYLESLCKKFRNTSCYFVFFLPPFPSGSHTFKPQKFMPEDSISGCPKKLGEKIQLEKRRPHARITCISTDKFNIVFFFRKMYISDTMILCALLSESTASLFFLHSAFFLSPLHDNKEYSV